MDDTTETDHKTATADSTARAWMARQAGYNKAGARYENRYGGRIGRAYHRRRCEKLEGEIARHFPANPELDILELGCGTGMTVEWLCKSTSHRIYALDFSSTFLGLVGERTAAFSNRPSLMLANAIELPFADESFDVIYATRFVHQFPHCDKLQLASEIRRVLRPGGLALLEFYSRAFNLLNYYVRLGDADVHPTLEEHLSHYPSAGEVREIVGGDFRIESLRFFADRYVNRILGYRVFSLLNGCMTLLPPLRWLMNEHWVIYAPKRTGEVPAKNAKRSMFEIIRCPKCRGQLTQGTSSAPLICKACHLAYPVVDGVPNLLSHEAQKLTS
jgi:ubiquinone/menaquinone biosynthesis C-methylase UbiE/uncharacterized protein YbaR (Trm112 family)